MRITIDLPDNCKAATMTALYDNDERVSLATLDLPNPQDGKVYRFVKSGSGIYRTV